MWIIRNNPIDIIARTALDVHPPAYYLAAKIWTFAFGDSVFAIRSLSLVFSLATIFLVYKIIENIWNKKAAFWASMLIAFSPFLLRLTQEARMYIMVAFFIALAVYFFVKYLKEKKSKYLLFFIPAMAVAMYTQYYSFFAIISLWVIMAILTPNIFKHNANIFRHILTSCPSNFFFELRIIGENTVFIWLNILSVYCFNLLPFFLIL
jgi:uncharacterized membrane protein